MFFSLSFFITFATAISKSSCVTCTRRSRNANMPASVHTDLVSAPDASFICEAILRRSMPRVRFMRREWIRRMSRRASSFGLGNSILRSIRPGRRRAESRMSIRLVAMITLIWLVASKPSSWLRSSSIVRCTSESPPPEPPSMRAPPIESISSMKMMEGACSRAITKSSRTIREPSPMYFCTSSEPETRMKVQSVWCATARASSVLPVPGGPCISTPLGCAMPSDSNSSGCLIGSSITSLISFICLSQPPIMSYVESGTFSSFISETSGSTLLGSTRWSVYESLRSATRSFGLSFEMSIALSMSTTYLPSGCTLTSTFLRPITLTTSPTYEPGSCSSESSSRSNRTCAVRGGTDGIQRGARAAGRVREAADSRRRRVAGCAASDTAYSGSTASQRLLPPGLHVGRQSASNRRRRHVFSLPLAHCTFASQDAALRVEPRRTEQSSSLSSPHAFRPRIHTSTPCVGPSNFGAPGWSRWATLSELP
mmetsp:Transcript_26626/g.80717  ORF Transcript_26626/g.80717 Transcript_26626/m.80717 type:complete len:483 (-) Transcript_26626:267-1715(-)